MSQKKKSLRAFVREHKDALVAHIRSRVPNLGPLTLDDIEDWVANDEDLYNWALKENVDV